MSREEDLRMWEYWRDDKGLKHALKEYFPQTLKNDPDLRQALAQIENAERAINARMEELAGEPGH